MIINNKKNKQYNKIMKSLETSRKKLDKYMSELSSDMEKEEKIEELISANNLLKEENKQLRNKIAQERLNRFGWNVPIEPVVVKFDKE